MTTLDALVPLLGALGDLKRTRAAGKPGSFADRAFLRSWAALAGGADPAAVARAELSRSLVATRLGAIDTDGLRAAGLDGEQVATISERGLDDALAEAGAWAPWIEKLLAAERPTLDDRVPPDAPAFSVALAAQPRAGAAVPGHPRIIVEPTENHAEHCVTVALYGAMVAGPEGADVGTVFVAALAHHLHNAALPDAGFTGESLLGIHLSTVVDGLTARALSELPPHVAGTVRNARAVLEDASTPEGRAFHTADVLDRVLQARHHARAAAFTLEQALDEMDLVHEGPLQAYHLSVLRSAGLWR